MDCGLWESARWEAITVRVGIRNVAVCICVCVCVQVCVQVCVIISLMRDGRRGIIAIIIRSTDSRNPVSPSNTLISHL